MAKRTQIGYLDGEPLVAAMERAAQEGNVTFIAQNIPRLEATISQLQDQTYNLAGLQQRARVVRDQHEKE